MPTRCFHSGQWLYTHRSVYRPAMPRPPTDTRRRILDAAYGLLYRAGFSRAGVDAIAEAAGITKRTLYYHFESKDALLAAVLEIQGALALARIERWTAQDVREPVAWVRRLFAELSSWCRRPDWRGSGFTRAAIEYAGSPGHPARRAARRHKAAVENVLAAALLERGIADAPAAARDIALLIEGAHALVLIHGDPGYAAAAGDAAVVLVERRLSRARTRQKARSTGHRRSA